MLKPTWRWVRHAYRGNVLCRRPPAGTRAQTEEHLAALVREIGLDRLPYRTGVPRLAAWLESLHAATGSRPPARPRRVLLFSVMAHWVEYCLPLALALAGRDCLVDYLWLPYPRLDVDILEDPWCKTSRAPWPVPPWVRLHPRVRVVNLLHVPPGPLIAAHDEIARRVARTDTQYVVRRELIDEEHDEQTRRLPAPPAPQPRPSRPAGHVAATEPLRLRPGSQRRHVRVRGGVPVAAAERPRGRYFRLRGAEGSDLPFGR
jgi:hypothetical protein